MTTATHLILLGSGPGCYRLTLLSLWIVRWIADQARVSPHELFVGLRTGGEVGVVSVYNTLPLSISLLPDLNQFAGVVDRCASPWIFD